VVGWIEQNMTRWRAFRQLVLARVREFFREPEAIFWVYGFPILLALGLGVAFKDREPTPPNVDIVESAGTRAEALRQTLTTAGINAALFSEAAAKERLFQGKSDLYVRVEGAEIVCVYDAARAESVQARHQVDAAVARGAASAPGVPKIRDDHVSEPGSSYIDFLMPGLIGMNIMGGGLFGVGFVLVDMRVRKLFKRFMATPMHRGDFLLSLLASRLVFLLPEMAALLAVGAWLFGVPLRGSFVTLLIVILIGAFAFAGLGLFLGCRTDKTETMSGYLNLVMLPMWLLSGVFFSSKRFPEEIQPVIQALPLTQLNDALRAVMLEGAGLWAIGWRLAILAVWGLVCFTLALRWFRWQ
jgi:ABC-2 type transport system permease protein